MQFHLNGFQVGDPAVAAADPDAVARAAAPLGGTIDVLVVGCGPAGLTLAAQLSAFGDITTRIIEQKPGPLELGQADGVACRTMEMFEAFGFGEKLRKEAYWVNETAFWEPDRTDPHRIVRSRRIRDTEEGLSEQPHVILNQARVHDMFLDVMARSTSRLEPDYGRRLVGLRVDPAADHAVTARIERVEEGHEDTVEEVRARVVVGCDGARSRVRRLIGRTLHGDSANQAWGVMDVLAVTDFPDIRLKTAIHSANEGNLLIIPREGGYLVRLYIELDQLAEGERLAGRTITSGQLVAAAQRILQPYTLAVHEIAWWSVYEIGQRMTDAFDDADRATGREPHVFIAGDACHTHSPKAGQGMNVSMRDSFNLGWKLAAVLRGQARPALLHTYSAERHAVAAELIDFDREFARMFSAPPKAHEDDEHGVDPAEFQRYFVAQGRFTAGTETRYAPSIITGEGTYQHLASGLQVGMRFHSAPVVRLADAKRLHLGQVVRADGRWRLILFADALDPAEPGSVLRAMCAALAADPRSPVVRYTPPGADVDAVIDVRAVAQQPHRQLALEQMPGFLLPQKGRYGLRDYEKLFCPDLDAGDDVFAMRGIDRGGCMVVVRPDQHIADVLPLGAVGRLADFFDAVLLPPQPAA